MYKSRLQILRMELQEISNQVILDEYITDKIEQEETFENINIEFTFSEDYIELFQQYVDLYLYQNYQQLPFKILEQLITLIKQSPTLHHTYLILKMLYLDFSRQEYVLIVQNIALAQKLIGLCVRLTNMKIKKITFQTIKLILPIINRIPAFQISLNKIIEQFIEQQKQNESITDELDFLNLVIDNEQYFQSFQKDILVDYCFYFSLKQKETYQIIDSPYNYSILKKLKSHAVGIISKFLTNHNSFENNQKYFKKIYKNLHSNDPLTIKICLQLLNQYEFNYRELMADEQIMKIFLNNQKQQSKISVLIIQLLSKILLKERSYVQLLLNKKFKEILLDNFQSYFKMRKNFFEIIAHLRLIEILFQEDCIQAYNQYCPQVLILFIKCLDLKDQQILLLLIDIIYNILTNVPNNSVLANKNIFRQIINLIDQSKSIISPEVSIDDDPQLIILRICDLDITKQILRKTFFEKWFKCLNQ